MYDLKRAVELLEKANEEIQNCYGRDTELTEEIYEFLEVAERMVEDDVSKM